MSRCPDEQKICIRGMPSGVSEDDVRKYFSPCGEIIDLYLKDNGTDTFGFVGFDNKASQETAMGWNGKDFNGSALRIEPKNVRGPGPRGGRFDDRDSTKIVVRNLNADTTDEEIRSFFEKIGAVNDFFRRDGAPFCFVGFTNANDYNTALRQGGQNIGSSQIRVEAKGARLR